jgi:hypothetical protein
LFEEICGTLGPHRLFVLEPGEWLHQLGDVRIGDRLYFIAGTGKTEFPGAPAPVTATVSSTGLCGEDRRFIADDIRIVFEREKFPGALFGCRGEISGDLFVLDPAGVTPPRLLVSDGCDSADWTSHGIVRKVQATDDAARLLFYPYPADLDAGPIEPTVLVDSIAPWGYTVTDEDELLALDLDGNLLQIDLPDGELSVVQAAVARFSAGVDGRYLIWEDRLTGSDDPEGPRGDLVLRDRRSGIDTVLAKAPHAFGARLYEHEERVELSAGRFAGGRTVALPSLAETEIPAGRRLVSLFSEDRWLMEGEDGGWYIRNPVAGTETLVTRDPGSLYSRGSNGMRMLREPASGPDGHFELWHYPFDGGEPELRAARVTAPPGHLADSRTYTVVDADAEGLGELVLVDPLTLAEHRLDDRVHVPHPQFGWFSTLVDRDTIAYQVFDGERSGVWIARPAAE